MKKNLILLGLLVWSMATMAQTEKADKYFETYQYISAIEEFDRVCGGGLVPGSIVLIGGDPGIGKSTLLLQVSAALSADLSVSNKA